MMHFLLIGILLASSNTSPGAVQFADNLKVRGETAGRLAAVYDRLTSQPLSDPVFTLSDVSFELARRFTEYSGDISGRVLTALNDAAPLLDRKADIIPTLLAGFAKYQKADGHFGADQQLDKQVNQDRDMPILWGNGRLLFGLARYCKDHKDPKVLEIARKLGDYMCSTRKYYGKEENFKAVGGLYASGFTTCYPSMVDGLVALADVTGDKKYAEEARFIANLSLLDDVFTKHHSHGRFTTYRGMLDLDYLAGTRDFVDKVRMFRDKVVAEYELPTGGVTELFDRDYIMDEGCTEADWLWVHLLLWRATGEAAYLDHAEHILRNHILATQFPNGGFGHWRLLALNEGDKTWPGGGFEPRGSESYWCCSMHGAMALAETARYALAVRDQRVVVTWLAEAEGDLQIAGGTQHVAVARKGPYLWQVTVQAAWPTDVYLRFRVPAWASAISIDGREHKSRNGWVDVTREDIVNLRMSISFPTAIRMAGAYTSSPEASGPKRIFFGPDMYCLPDEQMSPDLLPADAVPTIILGGVAPDGRIEAIVKGKGGKSQQVFLVPLAERKSAGCRHLFHAETLPGDAFTALLSQVEPVRPMGQLVQLLFTCDGECEFYFNGRRVGTAPNPQQEWLHMLHTDRPVNVVTVRIRSKAERPALIGMIRAGGDTHVTDARNWTAVRGLTTMPVDWMADAKAEVPGVLEIDDRGAWGVDPWKHITAQYAGTGAHWIWPAGYESPAWYAVRYVFTMP